MIRAIVNRYQAVFVFVVLVIVVGLASYAQLPRESFPEIRRPLIFVTTTYAGVSASDMETLITKEIEDELDGIEGLDKLTSTSVQSRSQVIAEFFGDTDVETALRRVKERVDIAKTNIPEDADEPIVRELNFSDTPILIVSLGHPGGLEILEQSVDDLEEAFKKVSGVQDVTISGKLNKEVAINLNPAKLSHFDFAIEDVIKTIRNENRSVPGGTLSGKRQDYTLSVSGEIKDPKIFSELVVQKDGREAKIRELGTAAFTYAEPLTIARMNQKPAITLNITKRSGENLLEVADQVFAILDEMKPRLPHGTEMITALDGSRDIRNMVADLENNILSGLLCVLLVTLFFLGPVNATFVSLGIPFSMLLSFGILSAFGITLNMIVLFSLVLALGMLVDNGIVIVENIYRHRALGKDRVEAAIVGTSEVALPISTSTLTTILAFFPIVFMPDIMGEIMSFIPKTVIIVLISSLIIGLTITSVFCSRFLTFGEKAKQAMIEGRGVFLRIQSVYKTSLKFSLRYPFSTVFLSLVIVLAGMVLNGMFGKETIFFPILDPQSGSVIVEGPPGTPLEKTDTWLKQIEATIEEVPASKETVQGTAGRGSERGSGTDASKGKIRVGFSPFLERDVPGRETLENLREKLADFPDAKVKVREQKDGPPAGNDISWEITGDDYTVLGEIAEQVLKIIEKHEANLDVYDTDYESAKPEIKIEVDREKAARYGFNTALIASTVREAFNGSKISTFRQGKDEYDVVVRYQENYRDNLDALKELNIVNKGRRIALASIAEISYESSVGTIKRRERQRAVSVWGDFKPGFEGKVEVSEAIAADIAKLDIPAGYSLGKGEGDEVRQNAQVFLGQAFMVALMLIFMVLVLQFNSVTQPLIILASVFLSLGGVFWGLFIAQMSFVVIMSGIGVISLAGVVVNNAIVLIDYINQLVKEGMTATEAVIEGGSVRLRPVLLTALTTVIGLLPMALGISLDFHEFAIQWESESSGWWSPMAWSIIFGLIFATFFTLIVVPCLVFVDFKYLHKKQV